MNLKFTFSCLPEFCGDFVLKWSCRFNVFISKDKTGPDPNIYYPEPVPPPGVPVCVRLSGPKM